MPIPDFQTVLLPLLRFAGDGEEHSLREAILNLANHFQLNEEERSVKIPSGYARLFDNRVGWARTHLLKAGLIESVRRAIFKITDRGKAELQLNTEKLTVGYLKKYPEYLAMFNSGGSAETRIETVQELDNPATPDETFAQSYAAIKAQLASDILEKVKQFSSEPIRFEDLVVKLLMKMGYGGNIEGAGLRTQRSRDGGIDGIIKEDQLGLDLIYLQAKCFNEGTIGRKEIQAFVGAMDNRNGGSSKGVFITTVRFTPDAIEYASQTTKRVVLIDGPALANLMIDFNIGVSTQKVFELKTLDNDFFE